MALRSSMWKRREGGKRAPPRNGRNDGEAMWKQGWNGSRRNDTDKRSAVSAKRRLQRAEINQTGDRGSERLRQSKYKANRNRLRKESEMNTKSGRKPICTTARGEAKIEGVQKAWRDPRSTDDTAHFHAPAPFIPSWSSLQP